MRSRPSSSPLVRALNRAFHEIDAYIQRQRRFIGNAAHQLRTPLTLLRAKIDDMTEPALKVELVRDVRRLSSLVSAMLDLARLQNHAIEKRPIDLEVVTRDVLADFSPSALDAGIELSLEQVEEGTLVVHGVEAAIRSALANLVGNALVHARGAGRVVANLDRGSVSICDRWGRNLSKLRTHRTVPNGKHIKRGGRTPGDHGGPRRDADHHIDARTRDDGYPPFSRGF
jgi:signal transduction histidine kinase